MVCWCGEEGGSCEGGRCVVEGVCCKWERGGGGFWREGVRCVVSWLQRGGVVMCCDRLVVGRRGYSVYK